METTSASQVWADSWSPNSDHVSFHMIDVGEKASTRRMAQAQGEIHLSQIAFLALKENRNQKGNVLALAEAAGIMAAKKTSELIPLCHPLPLHSIQFKFHLCESSYSIRVLCEARTFAQTGVEMEALCGVNGALLTIYDLSKAVDPVIEIKNIKLNFKEGGKSGVWRNPNFEKDEVAPLPMPQFKLDQILTAVLTISDRVSNQQAEDKSGLYLTERLKAEGAIIVAHNCIHDDISDIQKSILQLIETKQPLLLLTTGGTGLSPRDVTPEALQGISNRMIPGFGELLRQQGAKHISTAWLSRSIGCVIGNTLVIALPGSPKACREGLDALLPVLKHALHTLRGGNHDSLP